MRPGTHLFLLIDEIDCAFVTRTCVSCRRVTLSRSVLDSPKAHILRSGRYITFGKWVFSADFPRYNLTTASAARTSKHRIVFLSCSRNSEIYQILRVQRGLAELMFALI